MGVCIEDKTWAMRERNKNNGGREIEPSPLGRTVVNSKVVAFIKKRLRGGNAWTEGQGQKKETD